MSIWLGMQRPSPHAAVQERVAELALAGRPIGKVAEGSIERLDAVGGAGVDHPSQRVVPQVLLVERALGARGAGIGEDAVGRMAAADARGLHAPRGGKVGWAQAHAVHARTRPGDRLDVVDAFGRLQDGVDQDRLAQGMLGLELCQQLVQIVDVPRPLDLGQHDDFELGTGRRHDLENVVECPG